ncbi:unnamed protein product [Calicophoron daubneyi]|uniref:Glutamyl-tRNA(Gln) amidotransferase subunit C, mitochondrial n=1 Tax=Calicophoron daubneyi TaxID=300641 RepID=A0AAV2TBU9_CALDB
MTSCFLSPSWTIGYETLRFSRWPRCFAHCKRLLSVPKAPPDDIVRNQAPKNNPRVSFRFVPPKPIWRRFDVSLAAENENPDEIPSDPDVFFIPRGALPGRMELDMDTIRLLERLSLVDFGTEKSLRILEEAIRYADPLLTEYAFQGTTRDQSCSPESVAPMYSLCEEMYPDLSCPLEEDIPNEDQSTASRIVSHAPETWEGYFVAPPGNIPLEPKGIERSKKSYRNPTGE